jgi:hypothetical protein
MNSQCYECTRSFCKIAVLERNRQRQESLLPLEGKVAIVSRQQKVLHKGRGGALAHQLCRLASGRVPAHNLLHAEHTCLATNLDDFWINGGGNSVSFENKFYSTIYFSYIKSKYYYHKL